MVASVDTLGILVYVVRSTIDYSIVKLMHTYIHVTIDLKILVLVLYYNISYYQLPVPVTSTMMCIIL